MHKSKILLALLLSLNPPLIYAISDNAADIKIGETSLYPQLSLTYLHTNNLFRRHDEPVDTAAVIVKPELLWKADKGGNSLSMSYQGEITQYADVDNLDSSSHLLGLDSHLEFSSKTRLDLKLHYSNIFLDFESHLNDSIESSKLERIEIDENVFGVVLGYGADKARGNLEFGLNITSKDYTNLFDITDGLSYRSTEPSIRFLYSVSSDTRLTLGTFAKTYDYDESNRIDSIDNQQIAFFTGARWDATGKSGGRFEIGSVS